MIDRPSLTPAQNWGRRDQHQLRPLSLSGVKTTNLLSTSSGSLRGTTVKTGRKLLVHFELQTATTDQSSARLRRVEAPRMFDKGRSYKKTLAAFGILIPILAGLNLAGNNAMAMNLMSPAFKQGGQIPSKYTCEGEDISPPLKWDGVPEGTKSLVLIVDDPDAPDPDAPKLVWVHWVLFNIPPEVTSLPEGVDRIGLPPGIESGVNDFKKISYGGPCPPTGRHRYFHKLYALDAALDIRTATKAEVAQAMDRHVLAMAELVGTYQKGDP